MQIKRKLIVESPLYDLQYEMVQENKEADKKIYFSGPFIVLNKKNKNGRIYEEDEMVPAVNNFIEEYVKKNRAGGECNHSDSPDVSLERIAHKIISLKRDNNDSDAYIGKSEVITANPAGRILEGLIKSNFIFGASTKCLGVIQESSSGNLVKNPILIAVDAVYEPSGMNCYVQGILENREYIIGDDGRVAEAYAALDKKLSKYPSKHSDEIRAYIVENLQKFLAKI